MNVQVDLDFSVESTLVMGRESVKRNPTKIPLGIPKAMYIISRNQVSE